MDSLSSSSSDEECDSRVDLSMNLQEPQPPPYFFTHPNTSQAMFDDPISKFLLQQNHPMLPSSHLPVSVESNALLAVGSDHSASLSNHNLAPDPEFLNALMMSSQSQPDRLMLFNDPSLNRDTGGLFRNPTPPFVENAQPQGSVDMVQPIKSNNKPAGRNRKKRTRASRRAPTTVMTTDTTNFRAMVQEFTGIPATSLVSSHLHRAGIGLLGPSKLGFGNKLEPQHPYSRLFRPFGAKAKSAVGALDLDHSLSSAQFMLPSDLSLLNFQSFADQVQVPMNNGTDKYPVLTRANDGGHGINEQANHSAPMVDFPNDQELEDDRALRIVDVNISDWKIPWAKLT